MAQVSDKPAISEPSALGSAPPIVVEGEVSYRGGMGGMTAAIVLGVAALVGVVLLTQLGAGMGSSASSNGEGSKVSPILTHYVIAVDGKGIWIRPGLTTDSDKITLYDYSNKAYSTKLRCTIDSFPVYCDGGPVAIQGLPPGKHLFSVSESRISDEVNFGWFISP